jgi:hypothetical protein
MISDKLIKADKLIKVGIAEDHPLARRGLVDLLGTTEDPVVLGQAPNGEGAPVPVKSMVRFSRLDPEWVGPLQGYYDVYLEAPFSPGVATG